MTETEKPRQKITRKDVPIVTAFFFVFLAQAAFFLILAHTESWDFTIPFFVFFSTSAMVLASFFTGHRLLLRTIALFAFFHLLFFPLLYLGLVRNDRNAIVIDNDVYKMVGRQAAADILSKYDPAQTEQNIALLGEINRYYPTLVDQNLKWLTDDNVLVTNRYIIRLTERDPETPWESLIFYEKSGKKSHIISFREYEIITTDKSKISVRNLIEQLISFYTKKRSDFDNESLKIKQQEIWTYNRILPYSVNIFNAKNIRPVSALANIVVFVHRLLVVVLLLGLIATLFRDVIMTK